MREVLKKFGRYFLLDQIAQGGMAEIYRARDASRAGAGRLLAIKRVQAGLLGNPEFMQMFNSEVKVMMRLNHPNIAQFFEVGTEHKLPYIAMEWVDGKNLRQFISRYNEIGRKFPVDLAAYIIEQAAQGLHYAHSYRDKVTGEPLNIIHRDISPQNILISYEGGVKLIDFGIAKATLNDERTRAGVIKGKPSYLSPEQISGEPLDGRCDIFALGSVFWEILTGKKLFAGDGDLAVLKLIESSHTTVKPPSTVNPEIPKELDAIVMRALAKDREKRYQTAEELQRALHKFIYRYNADFEPSSLAGIAKELFKSEIVEDRKRIQRLSEKSEQLLSLHPRGSDFSVPGAKSDGTGDEDTTTAVEPIQRSSGSREAFDPDRISSTKVAIELTELPPRARAARSSETRWTLTEGHRSRAVFLPAWRKLALAAVAAGLGFAFLKSGVRVPDFAPSSEVSTDARLVLDGQYPDVHVMVDGQKVAQSLPATINGVSTGSPVRIVVMGPGGALFEKEVTLAKGERRSIQVQFGRELAGNGTTEGVSSQEPTREPASPGNIPLRLNLLPPGDHTRILLNGTAVDPDHPVISVPLDEPLKLSVERPGYRGFEREFAIGSDQARGMKEWSMDVPLDPERFGWLSVQTTPSSEASLLLDGRPWVKRTPFSRERLPVGVYRLRLRNDVLGMEKTVTVTISEEKTSNFNETLELKN